MAAIGSRQEAGKKQAGSKQEGLMVEKPRISRSVTNPSLASKPGY